MAQRIRASEVVDAKPFDFNQLAIMEPLLLELLEYAKSHKYSDDFCANAAWFGYGQFRGAGIKPRLMKLVGWNRPDRHVILCDPEAYNVAYDAIYEALPGCGPHCSCTRM